MMVDPDDLLDENDVSFDLVEEDAQINSSSFSYSKKQERYSSFRLDDIDDAEEEPPKFQHRAPSPSPLLESHHAEDDIPQLPQTVSAMDMSAPRIREDSDDEDDKRGSERSRFTSERKINLSARLGTTNNAIPDSLDKVTVRTTTSNQNNKNWKNKQRRGPNKGPAPFGRQAQPLFSQNDSILRSMMRGWEHNGYGGVASYPQGPVSQMGGRNMMGMNPHNDWLSYHTDPYQPTAYQSSWSTGHGYQTHYSSPIQQYPQMNMSSPNYGFTRTIRPNMPYVQPVFHSTQPSVRNRLGPIKRDAPVTSGPPAKSVKTSQAEKHRNLREVNTVNKPADKKDEKEEKNEEPGVPGEADPPPPPPPPKEVDIKELFPETNADEMTEYMKKIEEQKRKRAMMIKEKETKRMREAQIKLEQRQASLPPAFTEVEKMETNGVEKSEIQETPANAPTEEKKPVTVAPEMGTPVAVSPVTVTPAPAAAATPPPPQPSAEEIKPSDEEVPGTKLVRVKTRQGKIVVRRVPLETLSKMKKLSPDQASSEAVKTVDPKKTVVLVENLSASTSKEQLFKMGKQVGPVLEAEVDGETKSGRIAFENAQSANLFLNKFQRKMVDLSMITLVLATADELWPPLPTQLDDIE